MKLRMMEVVVTAGPNRYAKLQSNDHHQQTHTSYLQFGCPSCHPTNSVKAQLQLTVIYNDDKPNNIVTFVVPELLPAKRYTLHVRVLMFKAFEIMHGSWLLHSV